MNTLRTIVYIWVIISFANLVFSQFLGVNNFEKLYEEKHLDILLDDESKDLLEWMQSVAGSVSNFFMLASIIPVAHVLTAGIYISAVVFKFGRRQ